MKAYQIHQIVGYILLLPLLNTIISGSIYWILLNFLNYERCQVRWMIKYHTMSIIGIKRIYPPILSLATIISIGCGLYLVYSKIKVYIRLKSAPSMSPSVIHWVVGTAIAPFLLTAAATGGGYTLGKLTGVVNPSTMMEYHLKGLIFPPLQESFVVPFLFLGSLCLIISIIVRIISYTLLPQCSRYLPWGKTEVIYTPIPSPPSKV